MRTLVRRSAASATLVALLAVAACGSDDNGGATTASGGGGGASTTAAGTTSTSAPASKYGIGLKLGESISETPIATPIGPYLVWNKETCAYEQAPEQPTSYKTVVRKVEGDYQIAYMAAEYTEPFAVANSKNVKEVAAKAGFKVSSYDLKFPSQTEALAVAKTSVLKKDVGVIHGQQYPALEKAFNKILQDDGCIPTVQMYLKVDNVPSMGANWEDVGTESGKWLADYATKNSFDPTKTAFVECTNPDVGESVNIMFDKAPEALKAGGFNIADKDIFKLVCKPGKAEAAVTDWFTAHPDYDKILFNSIDDETMQGMSNAIKKTGNMDKSVTIANGVDELGQKQIRSGAEMASIAFFPEKYGEWLVPILEDILAGNPVPSFTGSGLVVITKDNIDQYYPQ